ncbi:MAG: DUF4097 domain-containing protein [Candidatus Cloacimonetes bacterium]|nr:DUF4097 domain-containing protein [Candidatus Cloacimonadota bacterium]
MKKYGFIILILAVFSLLIAKGSTEVFKFTQELIELSFDNVKVEQVSFISGSELEVKSDFEGVIYNQDKHYLGISSPKKKAKIWLKLPAKKKYHVSIGDGNFYFDQEGLKLITNEGQEFFVDGKILRVIDEGQEVLVYKNGDLVISENDGDIVTINNEGITTVKDGFGRNDENLTNFWGKTLAAIIGVAARTAMIAIGDTPEEVIKTSLNEYSWKTNVGDMMDVVETNSPNFGRKDHTREVEQSFPAAAINRLSIDNFNGSVKIKGTKSDVMLVYVLISADSEAELDNVKIEFKEGSNFIIRTKSLTEQPRCSIRYEIELPAGIALADVNTSNGGINITGCGGEADIRTSNGSIDIEDYQGNLQLNTSNGSVEVISISGDVDIRTNNGKIEAENVSGIVLAKTSNAKIEIENCPDIRKAETANGKIMLEISSLSENLVVSTSNADIALIISTAVNCDIQARTSNGRIRLQDIKLDIQNSSENRLIASYNGGGKLIDAETSNASVNIYQTK